MMTRNKSSRQAMVKYLFALPVILLLFILFSKKEIQAQTNNSNPNELEQITVVAHGTPQSEASTTDPFKAFDAFELIDDSNITVNFDRAKVKKELQAIASRYDRNASKAHNEKVRVEFNKVMRATYKKHYKFRTEVFAVVDELIKEYNIGWAQESSNANGVSVIDWPSKEYLEQTKKDARASNDSDRVLNFSSFDATEKDNEDSERVRELLANGKNAHVSLESLIPSDIKNPIVYVDGKKITSKDPMYFTVGKIKEVKVMGNQAGNKDVVRITLNKDFKYTKEEGKKEYRVVTIHEENGDKKHLMVDESKLTKKEVDVVFKVVEQMPRFYSAACEAMTDETEKKKCAEMEMLKFIYSNIKYPAKARDAGIEGKVIVQFIVEKDGSVSDTEILREIGGGAGEESVRVIESTPKWVPGKQRGKNVRVQYTMPIRFKLEGDSNEKENKLSLPDGKIKEYIIDGKDATESEVEALSPKDIATIDVKKVTKIENGTKELIHLIIVKTKNYKPSNNENGKTKYYINGNRITKEVFLAIPEDDIIEIKKDGVKVVKNGKRTEVLTSMNAITKSNSNLKLEEVPVGDGSADTKVVWKEQTPQDVGFTYIKISPNPTDGKINIEYGSKDEKLIITGTDVLGKEIFKYNLEGGINSLNNIDISKAAKGIVLVTFRQGKNVYTEKVILQ